MVIPVVPIAVHPDGAVGVWCPGPWGVVEGRRVFKARKTISRDIVKRECTIAVCVVSALGSIRKHNGVTRTYDVPVILSLVVSKV